MFLFDFYFACWKVFTAFATATIRIRASGMRKFLRSSSDEDVNGNISQYDLGMVLKETMLNLGPTFIKVGQSLSTRPDIMGTEITRFEYLCFPECVCPAVTFLCVGTGDVECIWDLGYENLEEELGSPVESFFSYVSEEPVAAASFGQVYRGSTLDGRTVALKVQRPNLHHVVVRDIYIIRLGLGLLQKIAKRKNDLRLYADELGKGLVGELDYSIEAANASKFLVLTGCSFLILIHVCSKNISRFKPKESSDIGVGGLVRVQLIYYLYLLVPHIQKDRNLKQKRRLLDLVSKGVEASLVQLLETGLLHGDPHPGNLRYLSSGQIGYGFGLPYGKEASVCYACCHSSHCKRGLGIPCACSIDMDVVRPGTSIRRITMELENSLGEVEFKDGIPDVKFSRVLGKILSIAIKNHFRMPPYFTLVLRSLASLEGLAVAADPNFKTFEAAYPYVVLNKQKEFRWERLALFLRVGSTRSSGVFDTAHLVLRLLPSRDGIVLRKLLMTANGASLIRAMVSKEAIFVRQQLCRVIADVLYHWMTQTFGRGIMATWILDSARKDPALMLKFYWTTFAMVVTASVRACHRVLVSLSEAMLPLLAFSQEWQLVHEIHSWPSRSSSEEEDLMAGIPLDCRFLEENRERGDRMVIGN
ncbi:hypothetical protein POTOM_060915 [Populus tomentosa]|uniref:ABC1 atypical kinase-like domain-containing protein n=1 Tax=Populus tomentosa TaxID=118781 RepID=A0A8X7XTZ8_POPTO|nr:hypothetical protein POTOM_060915 [Populus tomentosa]